LWKLSLSLLAAAALAGEPEMARIPASPCPIGAPVGHDEIHKAEVAAFYIAKLPVTNAEYKRFVDDTGHAAPEFNSVGGKEHFWTGREFPPAIASHPVVNVSWNDAEAYVRWLAAKTGKPYRLPTEEEWEIAARGGVKGKPYPWGDGIDKSSAWYGAQWAGLDTLKPAGFGKPNAYGLLGMAGNVWQWTADWFVPTFNGRPVDEERNLYRVIRGGSWANEESFLTVNYRSFHPPAFRDFFVGFRVAFTAPPEQAPK
jgi:formylglycine-generating enzyme required for sulfatase activity